MNRFPLPSIQPLAHRLAAGRPVLPKHQLIQLSERLLGMATTKDATVQVTHSAFMTTRMANSQVLSGDDGDTLDIRVWCQYGPGYGARVQTNQLDDNVLHTIVQRAQEIAREKIVPVENVMPAMYPFKDEFVPVNLWHDSTIDAMTAVRREVIPEIMKTVINEQLHASGFIGLMAKSEVVTNKQGFSGYNEETDCEVTMTARSLSGKSSGWSGRAARDWSRIDHMMVAKEAVQWAKQGMNPVALEPGRRTAILSAPAVAQILRFLAEQFSANNVYNGTSGFAKVTGGPKFGLKVFDSRINMQSNPADTDGGYRPYFAGGYGTPAMTWVEQGVLKNIAYGPDLAMIRGKPYSEEPWSLRVSGGDTAVEQMISRCREGVYVNQVTSVEMVDERTGLVTGVTKDGCFLIKDGKIDRPIKNFRFTDSPFFFLNTIEALGPTERAAFGYTPRAHSESLMAPTDWPRRPMIVPPMMVRDFNFSALADAV